MPRYIAWLMAAPVLIALLASNTTLAEEGKLWVPTSTWKPHDPPIHARRFTEEELLYRSPQRILPLDANPYADWSEHLFTADRLG